MDNFQAEQTLNDRDFNMLCKLVQEKAGIILRGERHRSMLKSRLSRRLRALNISSYENYCEFLKSGTSDEELGHFINVVTTNVTSFFREPHHFTHLKEYLNHHINKPQIQQEKRLRIWSAAASTGEEPYSIAMTVADVMQPHHGWDLKILATDLDTNVLERGRAGIYNNSALPSFPAGYEKKYTIPTKNDEFMMADNLKKMLHFKHLNLLHQWPMHGPFDAIFCRNVFIYFSPETQKDIALRFAQLLRPEGVLYIGHSENLLGLGDVFRNNGKTTYINNLR